MLKVVPDKLPTSSVMMRARYQESLEQELARWVAKVEIAFEMGFSYGRSKRFDDWKKALDDWLEEKMEKAV